LQCFSFGSVNSDKFAYAPSISDDEYDKIADKNKTEIKFKAVKITIPEVGVCALHKETGAIYELDSYMRKNLVQLGTLKLVYNEEKKKEEYKFTRI